MVDTNEGKIKPVNDGQEFEALIVKMYEGSQAGLKVTRNYKQVDGAGRARQIDVLLEMAISSVVIKMAVECKDYARKVTIDRVEGFAMKIRSMGIQQGIMVSKIGFDEGARSKAAELGIRLLNYREALRSDWKLFFPQESVVTVFSPFIEDTETFLTVMDGTVKALGKDHCFQLYEADGTEISNSYQFFSEIWNEDNGPIGKNVVGCEFEKPVFCKSDQGMIQLRSMKILGYFGFKKLIREMPVREGQALASADNDAAEAMTLNTEGFHVAQAMQEGGRAMTQGEVDAYRLDKSP